MAIDSANKVFYMNEPNTQTATELCEEIAGLINSASADFEDLCQSSMIKKFARFKPEDYNTPLNLTEAQRAENHYGFGKESLYFKAGFSELPHAKYEYVKPKGSATSPNRIRDWDGYYHGAVSPLFLNFPAKLYTDAAAMVAIIANSTGKTGYNPERCVKLGDILKANNDLYVALYVFKDSNNQWLLPTDVKVNELSEAVFPTIILAGSESFMSESTTGRIYPYVIPELISSLGSNYTLIAVGVDNLKYQTDKIPLKWQGGGNKEIGDRWLFSMEIDTDEDRKTLPVEIGKALTGLRGTLTANLGYATKRSIINGRQTYVLNNVSSSLQFVTPSKWLFTQQDPIYIQVNITNAYGYMYNLSGTQVNGIEQQYVMYMYGANQTFTLNSVLNTLTNYQFDDLSGGTQLAFAVSIYARKYQNSTEGQVTILSTKYYYVSKP